MIADLFLSFVGQPITYSSLGKICYSDRTNHIASGPNARKLTTSLLRGPSGIPSPTYTALFPFFGKLETFYVYYCLYILSVFTKMLLQKEIII